MKNFKPLAAIAFVVLLGSCTKEPLDNLTEEESRIYITEYDKNANFRSYNTFSVGDSVSLVDGNYHGKQLNATDQAFINAVKNNMQQRGYTQVNKSANPDVGINVTRIISTTTGVIGYNDYWDYYGGYWDPYYWGYGGYGYNSPYWYSTYEIREGALSVDMLDLKNAASNGGKINLIWTGMIRGSGIFNTSNADSQIKALFDQSPYISKN
jgi:hypothetical protein